MPQWRNIPGWPYEASDDGQVRRACNARPLKPRPNQKGYQRVVLIDQGRTGQFSVHRLVALAFLGGRPGDVDHINGDRGDNRLANLRYLPVRLNRRQGKCKTTMEQAREIRACSAEGPSALASRFNLSQSTIRHILAGRTWREGDTP